MKTPKTTPARLASTVLAPATVWIHSGRMKMRMTPTRKTPTISSGKIIFTKRQVSHSHCCTSQASKRRASGTSRTHSAATATVLPVNVKNRPFSVARMPRAAKTSVSAVSPSATGVRRLKPLSTCPSPRQATAPISPSRTISAAPCRLRPSAPIASFTGTQRSSTACTAAAPGHGSSPLNSSAFRKSTFSVPAISNATSVPRNTSVRREIPSPGAKVALSATRAASPARKTMAMIMPIPMPKVSASTMRAMAKSAPSATPV